MTTTESPPSLTVNPSFRIQVLFENEPGQPTKEFRAGDLSQPTFDALMTKVFAMAFPKESAPDQYNVTFKYRLEELHASRWVNFDSTQGLGYAFQSNQDHGYVFLSASIVKKGAPVMQVPPSPVGSRSTASNKTTKAKVAKKARVTKPKAPSPRSAGSKIPVEQKILTALKELHMLGITAPPRLQVCMFSGYSCLQSKGYVSAMKKLKTSGFIEYPDKDTVCLTETGLAQAPASVTPATSNEEIQQRLKNMLKDKAPAIFVLLKDGRAHDRKQVASHVGYSCLQSKGFVNALKQMKSLKMIEYPKGGEKKQKLVQLTNVAFPFGRP